MSNVKLNWNSEVNTDRLFRQADEQEEIQKVEHRMNLANAIWNICKQDDTNEQKAISKIYDILEQKGL